MQHDQCYGQVGPDCFPIQDYTDNYDWRCTWGGRPLCYFTRADERGNCLQKLCQCDEIFARCLQRYPCPTQRAKCPLEPERNDVYHQVAKFIDPLSIKHLEVSALEVLAKIRKKISEKKKKIANKLNKWGYWENSSKNIGCFFKYLLQLLNSMRYLIFSI